MIAAAAAVLVAVVASAAVLLRPGQTTGSAPAAGGQAGQAPASNRAAPPSAAKLTPAVPRPVPNPRLGFTGTYRYESVVTKSTAPSRPVGSKQSGVWTVKTTCTGSKCTSSIKAAGGTKPFNLDVSAARWNTSFTNRVQCVNTVTGQPLGYKVPLKYTRTLSPGAAGAQGLTSITGSDRTLQTKDCKNQRGPRYDVRSKITITKVG